MNATRKAISAVAIFATAQLALVIDSFSHPRLNDWVTVSFMTAMIFYPVMFAYHAKRVRPPNERSGESPADSN